MMLNNNIALAGNPNAGKTTLFNALTGSRQHVGNYPGVTVEKKEGIYRLNDLSLHVVDLPGTYSLTAYSLEEVVARDYIVREKPALVINIIDASNLERNLYLTLQFMEMGIPILIALNMIDVARQRGIHIDIDKLSKKLGVPVVPTIARSGDGKDKLMTEAARLIQEDRNVSPLRISYGKDVDEALLRMSLQIEEKSFLTDCYSPQWTALKYLENDEQVRSMGEQRDAEFSSHLNGMVKTVAAHTEATLATYPEAMIADHRYGYIKSLLKDDIIQFRMDKNRLMISDRIDRILTHRLIGPIIMLGVIFGLYHFTFTVSAVPVGWIESFFELLSSIADKSLPEGIFKSMLLSGIIDGVGGVLGFTPLIMFMFLGIAFLEDSGYLARMAFMLDRVFRIFGLHGSSVMAFIVSGGIAGGCAVPGVMAARTLKSHRERLATLLTVPFMNCGAKLPVFALLVDAFFSENEAIVMFLITLTAWAGALLVARILRSTIVRGAATPFVMELPSYRCPTLRGLFIHTWERTFQYIRKAGTVILGLSIILWAMMSFPELPHHEVSRFEMERKQIHNEISSENNSQNMHAAQKKAMNEIDLKEKESGLKYSIAGRIGIALESISRYAGFDWRTNIALVGGFAAKEIVVSTLGTAYSMGDVDPEDSKGLADMLSQTPGWSPLVALSLIIFTIFYSPCIVAVVCISREAGGWKWGIFSMIFNTTIAFTLSVSIYQVGRIIGY